MFSKTLIMRLKVGEFVHGMRYIDGRLTVITVAPVSSAYNVDRRVYGVYPVVPSETAYSAKRAPVRTFNALRMVDYVGGKTVFVNNGGIRMRTVSLGFRDTMREVCTIRRVKSALRSYMWVYVSVANDIQSTAVMLNANSGVMSINYHSNGVLSQSVCDSHDDPEYNMCENTADQITYFGNNITCVSAKGNVYALHENAEGFRVIWLASDCRSIRYSAAEKIANNEDSFFDMAISDDERLLAVVIAPGECTVLKETEVRLYSVNVNAATLLTHVATYVIEDARYVAFNPDGLTLNVLTSLPNSRRRLYVIDL